MIKQYTTTAKPNTLNKVLTNETEMTSATIRTDELDVLRPYFICKTSEITGNYIYISELERYYFIDSIERIDNIHSIVHCNVDVLMSFKTEIENATGLLVKSTITNPYYSSYNVESRVEKRKLNFVNNNKFNSDGINILITSEG